MTLLVNSVPLSLATVSGLPREPSIKVKLTRGPLAGKRDIGHDSQALAVAA
jgi:hypothetical protein